MVCLSYAGHWIRGAAIALLIKIPSPLVQGFVVAVDVCQRQS